MVAATHRPTQQAHARGTDCPNAILVLSSKSFVWTSLLDLNPTLTEQETRAVGNSVLMATETNGKSNYPFSRNAGAKKRRILTKGKDMSVMKSLLVGSVFSVMAAWSDMPVKAEPLSPYSFEDTGAKMFPFPLPHGHRSWPVCITG